MKNIILPVLLISALIPAVAGAAEPVESVPFQESDNPTLIIPAGAQEVEVTLSGMMVHKTSGAQVPISSRCTLGGQGGDAQLNCPGLGTVALTPYTCGGSTCEANAFTVEIAGYGYTVEIAGYGFTVTPSLAATFTLAGATITGAEADGDPTAVVVRDHWFWGKSCEIEQSDRNKCTNKCNSVGGVMNEVYGVIDHVNDKCLAMCTCLTPGGETGPIVVDTVYF